MAIHAFRRTLRPAAAAAAVTAVLVLGCEPQPADPDPDDGWADLFETFEATTGPFEVAPYSEDYKCAVIPMDNPDPFLLTRYRATMRPGSHHFNLLYVPRGADRPPGLYEGSCSMASIPTWFAGSQWEDVEEVLPEGLAMPIEADVDLLLDVHYVNTSPDPIIGQVDIELGGAHPDEIHEHVGVYFNAMTGFSVPPHTTETWRARYRTKPGTEVYLITSHAHWQNDRFEILLYDADGNLEPLYESLDPLHPEVLHLEPPLILEEGQGFEVRCTWTNTMDEPITLGESGLTDEMCIMAAFYTPDAGFAWRYGVQDGERVD